MTKPSKRIAARIRRLRHLIERHDAALASDITDARREDLAARRAITAEILNGLLEDGKMRRHDEPPAAAPPSADWKLICRRQIRTADKIYNCGCEVPLEACGRNLAALLNARAVAWVKPGTPISAKPIDLPPPPPPQKQNPKIEIVDDVDVVASWKKTLALTAQRLDEDFGKARDLLMKDEKASELFRRATRVFCETEAKRQGVISVAAPQGF